ncbi:MAG TPA: haloacid dehalogenase-like hydrolase [Frankiaceae bacterium]|nr:haloacid dehalogenase-like hydrolase [Frankiaceae bacterium]
MTLIDPRAGVAATLAAVTRETGVFVDGELVASRLGPPLEVELAHWFPAAEVDAAADLYRALYPAYAIPVTAALPGAVEAVALVRASGARAVVVTAKQQVLAVASLEHVGITADDVVGWRWGPAKGETLREHGATAYVGDHVADVDGARVAGAVSVAVASGPCSADELRAYGADVVLDSLGEFGAWWKMAG